MTPSIFVIVPSYNEGPVLRDGLEPLMDAGYDIVVIDDGSTDDTDEVLAGLDVHAIRHPVNLGQGAALQTGMDYAVECGADIVVHFDADGQHRAEEIESLMAPVLSGEADVVLGSRFLRGVDAMEVPARRRFVLRIARVVNGLFTGVWLTDAHNGFRVLSRRAAQSIRLTENRMAHASEILFQIRRAGLRYVERPTTVVYTAYSQEKGQSSWNGIRIVIDLFLRRMFR
jgi:glycosyltransferase involved in cell wall biosynthesis